MRLQPVPKNAPLPLRDADAAAPDGAPHGDKLDSKLETLLERLAELQNRFYADGRHALLIVLQGRDASGKDGTIRHVFGACNPQGCAITSFREPSELEKRHDYLWRVHQAAPAKGMIGVFNRSHYEDVLVVRVHDIVPKREWSDRYRQINDFERILAENGTVILKFFLHISKKEQRKRLLSRLEDPEKNWKFRAGDLDDRQLWNDYTRAYRDALGQCSTKLAPWFVVPADEKPLRNYLIARIVVDALERIDPQYPEADENVQKYASVLE
jgi:PPK2 family polyphosphate:nucleotide phosphotransferase